MLIELREIDDLYVYEKSNNAKSFRSAYNFIALDENGIVDKSELFSSKERSYESAVAHIFESVKLANHEAWIRENMFPIDYYKNRPSSYGLKHVVERAVGEYISNGGLIYLLYKLGYALRLFVNEGKLGINCGSNACIKEDGKLHPTDKGRRLLHYTPSKGNSRLTGVFKRPEFEGKTMEQLRLRKNDQLNDDGYWF